MAERTGNGNGNGALVGKTLLLGMAILIGLGSWNLIQTYENAKAIAGIEQQLVNQERRVDRMQSRFEHHVDKEG